MGSLQTGVVVNPVPPEFCILVQYSLGNSVRGVHYTLVQRTVKGQTADLQKAISCFDVLNKCVFCVLYVSSLRSKHGPNGESWYHARTHRGLEVWVLHAAIGGRMLRLMP